ncbi:multiprotein-bridging factor 1 family protein [Dactylosporangium cerinum]|uniref:Multiprotein-bridging factor 1 family protein n=1 Tax=Dactylosporangium cerinum TaxID=1434730 RepID=A0ABV9WCZ1_9ACTN
MDRTGCTGTSGTSSAASSESGAVTFAEALRRWRMTRGLSQAALAEQVMYSRSLVNLVENGYRRATDAFARAADTALDAAGQLHAVWMSAAAADHVPTVPTRHHRMGGGPVAGTCAGQLSDRALADRLDRLERLPDHRDGRRLLRRRPAPRPSAARMRRPPYRRSMRGAHPWHNRAPRRLYRPDVWRADGLADQMDVGECVRKCRPSGRTPGARCGAQPHGLNGQHRPGPVGDGGSELRRRRTDGRVQPARASAVPRCTLSCLVEICGNECVQGRGAAYETFAGCRSQMAAVAGGASRDPPTSGRRSRCRTPIKRAARTARAVCSIRAQGRRGWLRPPGRAATTVRCR